MKKLILSFAVVAFSVSAAFAQEKKAVLVEGNRLETHNHSHDGHDHDHGVPAAAPATSLTPDNMLFGSDNFDFGTIEEGPAADHVFTFTNTGKEPLIIQRVQPSCGCTTPDWTKEPVAPGKTGMIKASYGTQGRPGKFEKTMTVFTNAGTKMVTFRGNVEKAPETSVPQNASMMRTN